ncbi:MAG: hypothetical protein ISS52_08500 [Dehalococcoidia bacterium]|nr:hypothetical protein [Dehalococcoidia bacterium]
MSEWSDWLDIALCKEMGRLYRWCGVYRVRLADVEGSPIEIPRLLATDRDGILAIGESVKIARRIREFHNGFEGRRPEHPAAEKLFLARCFTDFEKRIYKNHRIQFAARKLNDKSEAQKEEARLLKSYFEKCGELPPLNSCMPDKTVLLWINLSVQERSS